MRVSLPDVSPDCVLIGYIAYESPHKSIIGTLPLPAPESVPLPVGLYQDQRREKLSTLWEELDIFAQDDAVFVEVMLLVLTCESS